MENSREKILSLFQSHQLASIELAFILSEQTGDFWKLRQFIKKHKGDVVQDGMMPRMFKKVHNLLLREGITDMEYTDYCYYYMGGFDFREYVIFDLCGIKNKKINKQGFPYSQIHSVDFREKRYNSIGSFDSMINSNNFKERMSLNQGITEYLTNRVPNVGLKILIADYILDYPICNLYYSFTKDEMSF